MDDPERNEAVLYMGMMYNTWYAKITGAVYYSCGKRVDIPWNGERYDHLIGLLPQYMERPFFSGGKGGEFSPS